MLWKQFYLHICTLSNDSLFEWQLQCSETTPVHIIRNKLYWICCDLYKRCYFNHSIMLHILCMTLWEATVEITFHSRNQSFNYPFVFQFEMNTLFFLILFFLPYNWYTAPFSHSHPIWWTMKDSYSGAEMKTF